MLESAKDDKKVERNPQAFLELLKTINSCDDKHKLKRLLADNGELIRNHSPLMHKNTRNLANLKLDEIKEKCASIVLN
jgi:CDP-glycerol glycerophosphotransferase (TagB/SpsB family)